MSKMETVRIKMKNKRISKRDIWQHVKETPKNIEVEAVCHICHGIAKRYLKRTLSKNKNMIVTRYYYRCLNCDNKIHYDSEVFLKEHKSLNVFDLIDEVTK